MHSAGLHSPVWLVPCQLSGVGKRAAMKGRLSPMLARGIPSEGFLCIIVVAIAASGLGMACSPGSASLLELCYSIPDSIVVTAHQE